jgi:hypothetical protein
MSLRCSAIRVRPTSRVARDCDVAEVLIDGHVLEAAF